MEGLATRLRAAAEALGGTTHVEAGWLSGAAELLDRGEAQRIAVRAAAVWLEELVPEARTRKASLLSAWVSAAEALRLAIHAHESERGPLVEALFPAWRGPSLRRHADQALAAEAELQRRLSASYVARRLEEPATEAALRPALEALDAARRAWAVERDRPALTGAEADEVRGRLLTVAGETARTVDRLRWLVRAALVDWPDLADGVFPRRSRPSEPAARSESGDHDAQAPVEQAQGDAHEAVRADGADAPAAAAPGDRPNGTSADPPSTHHRPRPGPGHRTAGRSGKARSPRRS